MRIHAALVLLALTLGTASCSETGSTVPPATSGDVSSDVVDEPADGADSSVPNPDTVAPVDTSQSEPDVWTQDVPEEESTCFQQLF